MRKAIFRTILTGIVAGLAWMATSAIAWGEGPPTLPGCAIQGPVPHPEPPPSDHPPITLPCVGGPAGVGRP